MSWGHRAPTRPPGAWRDAKTYGAKVKAVRVGRGLKPEQAAAQLGMIRRQLTKIEQGKFLPARWVQERIYRWAVNGETFEGVPQPSKSAVKFASWPEARVRLPPVLQDSLRSAAARLRMTQEELIMLAVDRLLIEPGELLRYEQAAARLERAKVAAALQECPELRLFLQAELRLCIDMGRDVTPASSGPLPVDLTQWGLPSR